MFGTLVEALSSVQALVVVQLEVDAGVGADSPAASSVADLESSAFVGLRVETRGKGLRRLMAARRKRASLSMN